jgi:hypothetical protein
LVSDLTVKRARTVISAVLVLLLCSIVGLAVYPRFKRIEKRGPEPERVGSTIPGDTNTAAVAITAAFNDWAEFDVPNRRGSFPNKFPYRTKWSFFFLFHKGDPRHPLFPSDEEILLDRGADSFVTGYVRIPAALRSQDLYLYEPSGDYFWESEYFYQGQPAKFRCSFLIHIEPAKDSGVTVEIFEYQPYIWVGEYLGLSAHAILPAMLHDIRPAQPTTADRMEVLQMIQRAAASSPAGTPSPAR